MEWFKIKFKFYGPDSDFDYTGTCVYEAMSPKEAEEMFWAEHNKENFSLLCIA